MTPKNAWFTYLMTGTSNNGGEDSPGGVITGETSLAHAGAIVNDQSSNVLVTHPAELDSVWMLDRTYPLALYTPCPGKVAASYPRRGKVDIFPVAVAAAWSRYCRPDLPRVDRSRYILFREFSEGNLLIRKLCWVSARARKGKGEDG